MLPKEFCCSSVADSQQSAPLNILYANEASCKDRRSLFLFLNFHFILTFLHVTSKFHVSQSSTGRHAAKGVFKIHLRTTQSPQPMESPVMRDLAFWQCYSIIEQLMKKTTSSPLIPKIRFQLIKCHCWRRGSSSLTEVSQRVAPAPNGWISEKVRRRWEGWVCGGVNGWRESDGGKSRMDVQQN